MKGKIAALVAGIVLGGTGVGIAAPTFWRYIKISNIGNTNMTFAGNPKYFCAYHPSSPSQTLFCVKSGSIPLGHPGAIEVRLNAAGVAVFTGDGQVGVPTDFYPWAR